MPGRRVQDLAPSLQDAVSQAYRDSIIYSLNMRRANFDPVPPLRLVQERCCVRWCNFDLTIMEVLMIRAGLLRSLKNDITREGLLNAVYSFMHTRVTPPPLDDESSEFDICEVKIDYTIFRKFVCRDLFLAILAIPDHMFERMVTVICTGEPFASNRFGAAGLLSQNVCHALARVSARASIHGQWNPICGSLMLERGESKRFFLRTNSRRGSLKDSVLKRVAGIGIRRRGVDSFMRCDYCVALNQQQRRIENIVRMNNGRGSTDGRKTVQVGNSYTAHKYNELVLAKRRFVLHALFRCYPDARKAIAAGDPDNGVPSRPLASVSLEEVVPPEDVEIHEYVRLLNIRNRKSLASFPITVELVRQFEVMDMDDEAVDLYMEGAILEDDQFDGSASGQPVDAHDRSASGQPVDANEGSASGQQDGGVGVVDGSEMELDDGATDLGSECPPDYDDDFVTNEGDELLQCMREAGEFVPPDLVVEDIGVNDSRSRQNAGLLTALERLATLRRFHNEHISAERVLTYCAFETAALAPHSVITFTGDGMSKEKTKLPCKEKGKNDKPLFHVPCHLTGLQMSIGAKAARPTPSVVYEDVGRRRVLLEREKDMKKNPSKYTDEQKQSLEDELMAFTENDIAAAAGYGLVNNDFLYPYAAEGPPGADALISNILHVLLSDQVEVAPMCIVVVLDNASVNKSKFALRAFGLLLELIPRLREVQLMFPSVGHTHNSLDAHFGAISKLVRRVDIGTPQELAAAIETLKNTRAHTDFPYYVFSHEIGDISDCQEFEDIKYQHFFALFKDSNDDVRFNHETYLRFAEPLSERVNYTLKTCRELIPRGAHEKEGGCFLFTPGEAGRRDRMEYAKTVFPAKRDPGFFDPMTERLRDQLINCGMLTDKRMSELSSLLGPKPYDDVSLFRACQMINEKTYEPRCSTAEDGMEQDMALAMFLRMKGRPFKHDPMAVKNMQAYKRAASNIGRELVNIFLEGDCSGEMHDFFIDRLADYCKGKHTFDFSPVLKHLEDTTPRRPDVAQRVSSRIIRDLSNIASPMPNSDEEEDGEAQEEELREYSRQAGKRRVKTVPRYSPGNY